MEELSLIVVIQEIIQILQADQYHLLQPMAEAADQFMKHPIQPLMAVAVAEAVQIQLLVLETKEETVLDQTLLTEAEEEEWVVMELMVLAPQQA
jgi:hypothetical protein